MDKTVKTILAVAIGSLVLIVTGLIGYAYFVGNAQASVIVVVRIPQIW